MCAYDFDALKQLLLRRERSSRRAACLPHRRHRQEELLDQKRGRNEAQERLSAAARIEKEPFSLGRRSLGGAGCPH